MLRVLKLAPFGTVPGLCGVNRDSFMAYKLLGQPPMTLGTAPSLLRSCLN